MIPIPIVTCNGATLARAGAAPSVFFALDTTLVFDVPNAASFSSLTLKIVRAPDGTSPVLTSTTSVPSQITGGVAQPGDIWIRVVGQTSSGESRQITVAAVFKTRNQGIELVEVSDFADERLLPKLVGKLVATQIAADAIADDRSIWGIPIDQPPNPLPDGYGLFYNQSRNVMEWKAGGGAAGSPMFWGAHASGTYDAAFISALPSTASGTTRTRTITYNAGAGEFVYWAEPTSFTPDPPSFVFANWLVDGVSTPIAVTLTKVASAVSVGGTATDLWMLDNAGLGAGSLQVS